MDCMDKMKNDVDKLLKKMEEKKKNPDNLAGYFDANSARNSSQSNELNNVLILIKSATESGKRKIIVDKVSPEVESRLIKMGYEVYEHYKNLDENISERVFQAKLDEYFLDFRNVPRPKFITQTAIEW